MMSRDEIIAEVWRIRDAYVAAQGHDLAAIAEDLRRRQEEHAGRLVDRRKKPKCPPPQCETKT